MYAMKCKGDAEIRDFVFIGDGSRGAMEIRAGPAEVGKDALGGEGLEPTRRQIEERLGVKVDLLDVRSGVALRDRIAASPDLIDSLAPGTGILLRAGTSAKRRGARAAS